MIMFSHSTKKMAKTYKKDGDVDANGERIEHDASWWLANGDLREYDTITISDGKTRVERSLHCKYPYEPTGLDGLRLYRQ